MLSKCNFGPNKILSLGGQEVTGSISQTILIRGRTNTLGRTNKDQQRNHRGNLYRWYSIVREISSKTLRGTLFDPLYQRPLVIFRLLPIKNQVFLCTISYVARRVSELHPSAGTCIRAEPTPHGAWHSPSQTQRAWTCSERLLLGVGQGIFWIRCPRLSMAEEIQTCVSFCFL